MSDFNNLMLHTLVFSDPIIGRNWTTETRVADILRIEKEILDLGEQLKAVLK